MNLNPDDPRLTSYALGEMPENECAAFEAELQKSPECQVVVEEIRQTSDLLSHELCTRTALELSSGQRQTIQDRLEPANVIVLPRRKIRATIALVALAASVTFVIVWQVELSSDRSEPISELAMVNTTEVDSLEREPRLLNEKRASAEEGVARAAEGQSVRSGFYAGSSVNSASDDKSTPANVSGPVNSPESLSLRMVRAQTPPPDNSIALNRGAVHPGEPVSSAVPALDSVGAESSGKVSSPMVIPLNNADTQEVLETLESVLQTRNKLAAAWDDSSPPKPEQPVTVAGIAANGVQSGQRFGGGAGSGGFGGGGSLPTQDGSDAFSAPPLTALSVDGVGFVPTFSAATPLQEESELESLRIPRLRVHESLRRESATYPALVENPFQSVRNQPLSTFSIDVDTASYANVRRFLKAGRMPPRDAVRIEEMINYFSYAYPQPRGDDPFAASIEVASCPWNTGHRLVRIGLKGREISRENRPPSNFVFLIDVSGSMQPQERLPLLKAALRQLVKKMNERDRVALVVYASQAGLKLESTPCAEKEKILQAIDELDAGGSTNGGDGIRQAYRVAEQNFIKEGVNRVLLCTDGDFNVGTTDQNELVRMIQQKAKSGVFLTTLGVGTDNYKDALMQNLADKGNGNYHYLDTLEEAQKVLIDQMNGTLVTIAKDVKIQIEFNPAQVGAYRLIGYEKRLLRKEDFNNDAKDAGEIGAGHTVTALYEIVPAGRDVPSAVDDLKYQQAVQDSSERYVTTDSKELLTLKLRYKQPDGDRSRLLEFPITDSGKRFNNASKDFQFAAAVASFGMLLRDSEFKGNSSYGAVLELSESAKGSDEEGYRSEFLNLVRQARGLR
jgi:Ca-activated chloride channel family protein